LLAVYGWRRSASGVSRFGGRKVRLIRGFLPERANRVSGGVSGLPDSPALAATLRTSALLAPLIA